MNLYKKYISLLYIRYELKVIHDQIIARVSLSFVNSKVHLKVINSFL